MKLVITWFIAKALDFATTANIVNKYGWEREGNPLMVQSHNAFGWGGAVVAITILGGLLYLCYFIANRYGGRFGKAVIVFLWLFVLFNLSAGIWNLLA